MHRIYVVKPCWNQAFPRDDAGRERFPPVASRGQCRGTFSSSTAHFSVLLDPKAFHEASTSEEKALPEAG